MAQIELKNIEKTYGTHTILQNFNLEIQKGEFLGIRGESGKGKTTLLNIIGLQEECGGTVLYDGKVIDRKKRKQVRQLLNDRIGYLFQNFALIDDESVYDNLKIVMPREKKAFRCQKMQQALEKTGLPGDILQKKIYQFSGGEQQRIAVARLLLKKCDIILADEPTGSLDRQNGIKIMELLKDMNQTGKTIVLVTHDEKMLQYCSRIVTL
ncbi:MAG: ABC transporter ATP-binding protein [Lachnospiraceae bacterium]